MNKIIEVRNLIGKEYTARNICNELNISPEELYNVLFALRKDGLYYYPRPDLNAETLFTLKKVNSDDDLKFRVSNGIFSFIVTSDSHVGSIYDLISRFPALKEFINEYEINMLVNNGDLVDGPDHEDQSLPRRLHTIDEQVKEFSRVYPFICGTNIAVLGDHDLKYKNSKGVSANKLIREQRPDLKVFSSGSGIVDINNNKFLFAHDASDPRVKGRITDDMIVFSGHSHAYYNNSSYEGNRPIIRIVCPSISDLPTYNYKTPGFLKVNLKFYNNYLETVVIENYVFMINDIYYNGSVTYNMPTTKKQRKRE